MTEKQIQAIMIIEVAGRPAEFVKQGLETHVSKLDHIKDVEIITKKVSEPKKLEDQEAYVCFSEIEFKISTFSRLLDLIFDFMPSSIEIVHPGRISLDSQEATGFINNLAGRLHRYDELAKIAQFKLKQVTNELSLLKQPKQKKKSKTSK